VGNERGKEREGFLELSEEENKWENRGDKIGLDKGLNKRSYKEIGIMVDIGRIRESKGEIMVGNKRGSIEEVRPNRPIDWSVGGNGGLLQRFNINVSYPNPNL
jgi:hypothetical protein